MDLIKICALGGLDENGKDCYVVEINNDIFVIDAGNMIPDKTIPGIDCVLPNFDYLVQNKNRIKAYFITHGHDEAMAALKYFYHLAPAPIYCTYTTVVSLLGQAAIHHIKIKKEEFDFHVVNANDSLTVAGHKVELFSTAHNAPNCFGLAIKTDRGNIIFSSDFIIDFSSEDPRYNFSFAKLNDLSKEKTWLLMSCSKAANVDGYCAPRHKSYSHIEKAFQSNKRIFISCFWQNGFRLNEIAELCIKYHKKIYFYDKYTNDIMTHIFKADAGKYLNASLLEVVANEDFIRIRPQDMVILMVGHSGELYKEIIFLAKGENKDTRISLTNKDIFINCSVSTVTNEIVATHCEDEVYRTGCEVYWLNRKVISSMHARQDDLKALIDILKPVYYLPVRGSFNNLMTNACLALDMGLNYTHNNVFILDNGMQLVFEGNNKPQVIPNEVNKIDVSPVLVDGYGISKQKETIVNDRLKLGVDGIVVLAATISKSQKAIIAGPDCQMRGFVFLKESEPLLKSLANIFVDEINTQMNKESFDFEECKNNILDRCRLFIRRENGREPMIVPLISIVE